MGVSLQDIIGGSITDGVAKIISLFKVSPDKALEAKTETEKIQAEIQEKILDQVSQEMQASAEVIKAEAQSQSWLPRNVRPLLLLLWGLAITFNLVVPIVARFWVPGIQPLVVPDWVYKLTAIGFTGYVTARTWEKVKDADN